MNCLVLCKRINALILVLALASCASTESNINSGLSHYNAGLYHEATHKLIGQIASFEKEFPNDQRVSRSYLALGVMAEDAKYYDKAEEYLIKAIETAKKSTPISEDAVRDTESMLGNFYIARKKYTQALIHLNVAERVSRQFKEKTVLNAIDLDNIAVALQGEGDFEQALKFGRQALDIVERKPEEKLYNLTKGIILFNLAKGYQEVGDRPQAILSYHQAIELFTRVAKVDSHEQWRLDAAISAVNKL